MYLAVMIFVSIKSLRELMGYLNDGKIGAMSLLSKLAHGKATERVNLIIFTVIP